MKRETYWKSIVRLVHRSSACWAAFSGNDPNGLALGEAGWAFPARDGKHDKRHLWAALFGLNVGVFLAGHQGGELLNSQTLKDLMAADVGELVERHCVIR